MVNCTKNDKITKNLGIVRLFRHPWQQKLSFTTNVLYSSLEKRPIMLNTKYVFQNIQKLTTYKDIQVKEIRIYGAER